MSYFVKVVSHGRKLKTGQFQVPTENDEWLWDRRNASGLVPLLQTEFVSINNVFIAALSERWHKETNNFQLPVGEITATLDDVACLLHIPIKGKLMRQNDQWGVYMDEVLE